MLDIYLGVAGTACLILAALSRSIWMAIQSDYGRTVFARNEAKHNPLFWNPAFSWPYKWVLYRHFVGLRMKANSGIARLWYTFMGKAIITCFVWTTDAWHLFTLLDNVCLAIASGIWFYHGGCRWGFAYIAGVLTLYLAIFTYAFTKLRK